MKPMRWCLVVGLSLVLAGRAAESTNEAGRSTRSGQRLQEPARAQPPSGAKVIGPLEFGRAGDKSMRLDLYLPERSDGPLPLVIWIYGGAWRMGSRNNPSPALSFTTNGYAVAHISYRLSQEAVFPAQIHDCKAAVRWLRTNAKQYNLDPTRFAVWGPSAGGHLAALLGTSGDVAELDGAVNDLKTSSRVQAVVDWFGPTDLLQMNKAGSSMDHDATHSPESQLIGGPIQENKDRAAKANPITYVSRDDPPFLIMHGDQDRTVPFNQSELLVEALKKAGVEAVFVPIKGAGHGFRGPEPVNEVRQFLDRHLKAGKELPPE